MSARLALSIASVIAVAISTWWLRPPLPTASDAPFAIEIARDAAILYYNSPAAIQVSQTVHVGYVRMDGGVEVASIDLKSHQITRTAVHQYDGPDDHAAPALWQTESGLLVATSFHSSELFLYRVSNEKIEQICRWDGMYTYPRFAMVDGTLRLYVRNDPNRAGSLAAIDNPQSCSAPTILHRAEKETWLYVTVPDGPHVAWSVWNAATNKHTGAYLNGEGLKLAPSPHDETLMWSVAGEYRAATRFQDAFKCCGSGKMVAELYRGDERIYESTEMQAPYYPTGITIAKDATEALAPTMNGRFARRSLPMLNDLPTCRQTSRFNSRGQYVNGSQSNYIWQAFDAIEGRNYGSARIYLCLLHQDRSAAEDAAQSSPIDRM